MITTLEIMELARDGLRGKINSKKRLLNEFNECGYSGRSKQAVEKELEELKAKYKELEKMIVAEKDKMF